MLLIDGKELKVKGTNLTATEKVVVEKMKEIESKYKGKFPLRIKFADKMAYKVKLTDSSMTDYRVSNRMPESRGMQAGRKVIVNKDKVEIRYAETWRFVKKKGREMPMPKLIPFKGDMKIREDQLDLAFFMLYVSPHVISSLSCDEIELVDKVGMQDKYLVFEDKEANAQVFVQKSTDKATFEYSVLVKLKEEELRNAALVYGIANYKTKSLDLIRKEIIERVNNMDRSAGVEENVYTDFRNKVEKFSKKDGEFLGEVAYLSLIDEAIELNVIKFKGTRYQEWCFYDYANNKYGNIICKKGNESDEKQALLKAMETDDLIVDAIRRAVENEK